jgi:hypothetical protein
MSEYAVAPVSSETEVVLGGGKENTAVEAMRPLFEAVEALPLLPSPKRPHCSNCTAVEALPLLDGGLRRSGNNVRPHLLDGCRQAGLDLGPTCSDLGFNFFIFKK